MLKSFGFEIIIFVLLLIPLLLLWYIVFSKIKKRMKSALSYALLVLFSLIGIAVYYFIILLAVADHFFYGDLSDLIVAASVWAVMIFQVLIIPASLITIILAVKYFLNKRKVS